MAKSDVDKNLILSQMDYKIRKKQIYIEKVDGKNVEDSEEKLNYL